MLKILFRDPVKHINIIVLVVGLDNQFLKKYYIIVRVPNGIRWNKIFLTPIIIVLDIIYNQFSGRFMHNPWDVGCRL